MDELTQVAGLASGNININHVMVENSNSILFRDIERARRMTKNRSFFELYKLLQDMAESLNRRLGRNQCANEQQKMELLRWTDVVGDKRKKKSAGEGKKIPLIDLLKDAHKVQSKPPPNEADALRVQKQIKNFRFNIAKKEKENKLLTWQQHLLADFTEAHGIQIF